jgi:hypothetical protein
MPRIALGLSAMGASLLAAAVVILPTQGMAFDVQNATVDTGNATAKVPSGSTQFQGPDEKLLTAPSSDGSLQFLKSDSSDGQSSSGTSLQLAPGTTLAITGGTGPTLGLQSGAPMGPVIDHSNPADNRSLIPAP